MTSDHPHRHGQHEPEPPGPAEAPLPRGSGRGKLLFLDAFSGIAGDMTIAALLDLGVPFGVLEEVVRPLGLEGVRLSVEPVRVGAIGAHRFSVEVEAPQPERTHAEIDQLLASAPLDPDVVGLARRIFRRLAEAEAQVHRVAVEAVHFHEVGAVDAIVDVLGAAAGLVYLGAEVVVSPLPLGHGRVNTRHGWLPLPAPATVLCLRGLPTYEAGIEAELVTPTGAAIAATVATGFSRWPTMAPERVGWGAGSHRLPDRPNVLRVVLGLPLEVSPAGDEDYVLLESNLDDFTGELAGHALESLLATGALDAWVVPCTMKKGRPGMVLGALGRREQATLLAAVILRETSSLGVRHTRVGRTERPREVRMVETRYGMIPVKVSSGPYGPVGLKPEFDACRDAARLHGVPVREVLAEALRAARST
jgi:hypothetical protein